MRETAFRNATFLDWRQLAPLLRESFPYLGEGEVSFLCRDHLDGTELAIVEGRLAAASLAMPRPAWSTLWLEALAVRPEFRRRSLGRHLLGRLEARAARDGFSKIGLAVRRHNVAARRLYESAGFVLAHARTDDDVYEKEVLPAGPLPVAAGEDGRLRRLRDAFRRVAYRAVVTLPETGSVFFPPGGRVDLRRPASVSGDRLVVVHPRRADLPSEPVPARHRLSGHPLFQDERIRDLLRRVPREQVEIRAVETRDVAAAASGYARTERVLHVDPADVFERLGERPFWMNVHHAERFDPEWKDLLGRILSDLAAGFEEMIPEVTEAGAFLLLSSPRAAVHFHADPDHGFLFQLRGTKTVHRWPAAVLPEDVVLRLAETGDHDEVAWRPEYREAEAPPVPLGPGDGIFLPVYSPHRIENGPEVSVSLSVGFHTRRSARIARAHRVRHELRARRIPLWAFGGG